MKKPLIRGSDWRGCLNHLTGRFGIHVQRDEINSHGLVQLSNKHTRESILPALQKAFLIHDGSGEGTRVGEEKCAGKAGAVEMN
jgi:hypothetical protein